MPLPDSLTVINVRGTFLKSNGDAAAGTIEIFSIEHLVSSVDNTIVEPVNEVVELDDDGFFEIDLPATNDPQWAPLNYTYTVKEVLTCGVRTYRIAVPYDSAGGVLELADVSPVQSYSEPTTYVLRSTANQNGGYPLIDATTGKIPSSVIPAGGGEADGAFRGTWSGATPYITGDTVIRSGSTYGAIQDSTNQDPATEAAYWTEYPSAGGAVDSVNGETGVVVLTAGDVGADPAGTAATAVASHVAAVDPHGDRAYTDAAVAARQPLDADLTTIAGLTATTSNVIQSVGSAWASRTPAQLATTLNAQIQLGGTGQVTGLNTALAAKADLVGGTVPTAQIPAIAITEYLGSVASEVAMLALVGEEGDWAIRTDLGTVWVITGADPSLLADWTQLAYPTAPVTSVAGKTGVVTLVKGDVGLGNVDNTADTAKPVSTAQQTALDLKANLASPTFTGTVTAADATVTGRLRQNYDTLTDAATIATDASLGNRFKVTLTADRVLGNPTNAVDGQMLFFCIEEDGTGGHSITLDTKFNDPNGYFTGLTETADARNYLGVVYDSTDDQFDVLAFSAGY